jgi:chromosome segregation ATPase
MSEEATTQEAPQIAEGTRSPVEPKVSTEVEPDNQEQEVNEAAQNVNQLVSESRKYRKRAQQSEAELVKLQKQIESNRQKQMEENKQWQQLAEERAERIKELEPVVERAQQEEAHMRDQILNDFSEEDRDTFGDLPLSKLRALHEKLNPNNQRLTVANNPSVPANEVPKDWTKMDRNERAKNWDKIIASYKRT